MKKMKIYELHLSRVDYFAAMRSVEIIALKENFNDVGYFKKLVSLGFVDSYSYYSVVTHEKLLFNHNDIIVFCWRDGGNYKFEYNDDTIGDRVFSIKDFPVKQTGENDFELIFVTDSILDRLIATIKGDIW